MIKVEIYRNDNNEVYGFKAMNHSASRVCAAVSILTLNTLNSIECLTGVKFDETHEDDGFLEMYVPRIKGGEHIHDVNLLFEALVIGLAGIKNSYPRNIKITDSGGVNYDKD